MGGMPPAGPPPSGGGPNVPLIIVLVVLVLGAVVAGAILLTGGDDDDEGPTAGTTIPGQPGDPGEITLPEDPEISLPEDPEITLPEGPDVSVPELPEGGTDFSDQAGPPSEPPTEGDSALVALADECYNGDMQACDDLYMDSDFGSELEDYGDTCGHRFPESYGYCASVLPDPQLPN